MRFEQIWKWIEQNKPEVILEVGTWNGNNAKRMLKEGAKRYIGFDVWEEGSEDLDEIENNAKKRVTLEETQKNLEEFDVELNKGNTRVVLPEYVKGKKPFVDMALIDGGHSKTTIRSDLLSVLKIVKSTGVLFLDDYYFDCPTKNIGAQCVMSELAIPYTVLPKVDRAKDGSLIKIVQIDMKHVPRFDQWSVPEEESWRYKP